MLGLHILPQRPAAMPPWVDTQGSHGSSIEPHTHSRDTAKFIQHPASSSGSGLLLWAWPSPFYICCGQPHLRSLPPCSLAAQARQDIWPTCVQGRKDFCLAGQGLPVTLGVPCSRGSLLSGHSPLRALRSPRSMAGRHRWGLVRR